MKHLTQALVLSALLIVVPLAPSAAAQDAADASPPEEVLAQLETAINNGDYEAAAALHAEDVIITYVPAVFEEPPTLSRQELLTQLESIREIHPHIEIELQQVVGDGIVITTTHAQDDLISGMGLEALEFTEVYVIRDGLIHGTTSVLTSDSMDALVAAMAEMGSE